MEDNIIQLKKDNIFRVDIVDAEGNKTGEQLEFDLEDLELPFKLQECEQRHNRNIEDIKAKIMIIDKKQDHKGKKLLSKNEEEKLKVINEFYKKEAEALDLFLGENGTKKLLNGRKPYIGMFNDISESLEPVLKKLKIREDNILDKIRKKYSKKEEDVIE